MKNVLILFLLLIFVSACTTTNIEDVSEVVSSGNSVYKTFSEESYNSAINENKRVILFFYANWCPSCKVEDKEIIEAINVLERDDVVIFRVNYRDSETSEFEESLAKKYGITYQHTKIIISPGKEELRFVNTWNADTYLEELSKL